MSIDTFPILYFNMSGEMIYIIDQRLEAQKIGQSKAKRVLSDIILSIFNSKLINEVFKPHNTITFHVLRTIFEKLVHSSIMRLNEQSMNKLFDLMVMVIKYQLFACPKPSDIITVTDNHFISIIEMLKNNDNDGNNGDEQQNKPATSCNNIVEIVNVVRNQFLLHYQQYDLLRFQQIRYNLLNFLKDIRTRVSIFLREGLQTNDGMFVIPYQNVMVECECQIPGVVRYFHGSYNEIIRTEHFDVGGHYLVDDSRTKLGLNIYKKEIEPPKQNVCEQKSNDNTAIIANNRKEMDLLAKLICKTPQDDRRDSIVELKFDFLSTETENNDKLTSKTMSNDKSIQIIDTSDHNNEQLIQIIHDLQELSVVTNQQNTNQAKPINHQTSGDDLDLLELMDS